MLVLERLSDARRNGHPVLAVIAGSAVNQDGASNGLTAPNGPSQQRVIRAALAAAGLSRRRRGRGGGARHRHGAGRPDRGAGADRRLRPGPPRGPAAVAGLGEVQHRPHPQAAGVAASSRWCSPSSTRNSRRPCTRTSRHRTSTGRLGPGPAARPSRCPGPPTARPRRAGVSSFGISGTNAHVIIEEPPAVVTDPTGPAGPAPGTAPEAAALASGVLAAGSGAAAWPVSGKTAAALAAQAREARGVGSGAAGPGPGRRRVVAGDHQVGVRAPGAWSWAPHRRTLAAGWPRLAPGPPCGGGKVVGAGGNRHGARRAATPGKVVFVFPGQGASGRAWARNSRR